MEENKFLLSEGITLPLKRVYSDEQKAHAKSVRQQKRFERQQDPEEDKAFKDKHNSYHKNLSAEKKESNKLQRSVTANAERYASRSEEDIAKIKKRTKEIELEKNYTVEQRIEIKQV
jgi:hypothetical protein